MFWSVAFLPSFLFSSLAFQFRGAVRNFAIPFLVYASPDLPEQVWQILRCCSQPLSSLFYTRQWIQACNIHYNLSTQFGRITVYPKNVLCWSQLRTYSPRRHGGGPYLYRWSIGRCSDDVTIDVVFVHLDRSLTNRRILLEYVLLPWTAFQR